MNDLAPAAPAAGGAGLREVFETGRDASLNRRQAGVIRLYDVLALAELPTQPYAPSTVVADPVTWGPELYGLFTCQMALEQQRKYTWVAVHFLLCGGWAGNQLSSMVRTYLLYDLAPVPAWAAT